MRTKKRKRFIKLKIIIAVVCVLIISGAIYFMHNVTAVFVSVSEASVRVMNTVAVNEAISDVLDEGIAYDDLINIAYDENGDVKSITANTVTINRLARDTARIARENFETLSAEGVKVPLGALTGIEALAGFGPSIKIKIIPVNSLECRFTQQFTSAGINQTLHTLYVLVVADISIILPSQTVKITSTSQVLVAESVIAGRIPEVYLQAGWLSGGEGLVPQSDG